MREYKLMPTRLDMIIVIGCLCSSLNEFINHNDKVDAIYLMLIVIAAAIPCNLKSVK